MAIHDDCPWCGASSKYIEWAYSETTIRDLTRKHYHVECLKCMAHGPAANSKSEASELWNSIIRENQRSWKQEFATLMEITITALDVLVFDVYGNASENEKDKSILMDSVPTFQELYCLWRDCNLQFCNELAAKEGQYIRKRLNYHIDHGAYGDFSNSYHMYPKSWQKTSSD
ncbi:hypothetical protein [Maridesulfovibrio sp. FT414]|uniref:hypothetical protein n=1 Tax=Maridesulfovibrio sp. FT414 TaxID=2979469 RepID=UPI003D802DCA